MICPRCGYKWKDPGRVKGGETSKRKLTKAQARAMVAAKVKKAKKI